MYAMCVRMSIFILYIDKYNIMKGGKTLHKVQVKNFKLDLVNLVCYHENESWHNVMFANEIVLLLLMYKYMYGGLEFDGILFLGRYFITHEI